MYVPHSIGRGRDAEHFEGMLTPARRTHPHWSDPRRFVKEARLLEFEPGEVIFAQGEKGYDCFIIDDGEAEILDQAEDGTLESIVRRTVRLGLGLGLRN